MNHGRCFNIVSFFSLALQGCTAAELFDIVDGGWQVAPSDSGVSDAGFVDVLDGGAPPEADAGPADAGLPFEFGDAGFTLPDAGPQMPVCDPSSVVITPCEDDADFCDEAGDPPGLATADIDLLQGWSHMEDGVFVVDLQFASGLGTSTGPNGLGRHFGVALLINRNEDPSERERGWCTIHDGEPAECGVADDLYGVSSFSRAVYPLRYRGAVTSRDGLERDCSEALISADLRHLQFRLPLEGRPTPSALSTLVVVSYQDWGQGSALPLNYTETSVETPLYYSPSMGGMPDEINFDFISVCEAMCKQ